jgi:hypothetical protein
MEGGRIMKRVGLLLLLAFIVVATAHAYTVEFGVDSNSGIGFWDRGNNQTNKTFYGGTNGSTWLANSSAGALTASGADQIHYLLNQKPFNGTFVTNFYRKETYSGYFFPNIFGMGDKFTDNPYYGHTAYFSRVHDPGDTVMGFYKVVAGSDTALWQDLLTVAPNTLHNWTVVWTPNGTVKILFKINGVTKLSSVDTSIGPGWAGVGTGAGFGGIVHFSNLSFFYDPTPVSNFTSTVHDCTGLCTLVMTEDSSRASPQLCNWTVNGSAIGNNTVCNGARITLSPPAAGSITYTVALNSTRFTNCTTTTSSCYSDHSTTTWGTGVKFADWSNWNLSTTTWNVIVTAAGGTPPVAAFDLASLGNLVSSGYNATHRNASITARDLSTNTPTSWLWYPKGSRLPTWLNSSAQNPTFFPKGYSGSGTYQVCLMVTNAGGSDTTCKNFFVRPSGATS